MKTFKNALEAAYKKFINKHKAQKWEEHPLPGGKVKVSPDGMKAIVLQDGRYPNTEEGFQINDYITETATNLFGIMVVEFPVEGYITEVKEGSSIELGPKDPFSIAGKCICLIEMSEPWESSQKHYVRWDSKKKKYVEVN